MQTITLVRAGTPRSICLLALAVTLCAAGFTQAQEEPQAQEKRPTLAEAKAAFAKADRALNQAWSLAKTAIAEGRAPAELTQNQRDWLQFRDSRAGGESEQAGEKDPKRSGTWYSVATELTASRAEWLRGRARTVAPEETLTGVWIDSYGGTLSVVQQQGRLLFTCDVVRGPTYHTGEISGIASWNQSIGWFSDKGRDPEKTEESNLAFVDRDGCLEVIGANTSHYHGARAHFDGLYCKVGPLDEKAQAELIKTAESGGMSGQEESGGE